MLGWFLKEFAISLSSSYLLLPCDISKIFYGDYLWLISMILVYCLSNVSASALISSQQTFTCSKSTIEAKEEIVKCVQR